MRGRERWEATKRSEDEGKSGDRKRGGEGEPPPKKGKKMGKKKKPGERKYKMWGKREQKEEYNHVKN